MVHIYQEWSKEEYPTYANGPGYIISSDIAHFIVSNFEKHKLKVGFQLSCVCVHILVLSHKGLKFWLFIEDNFNVL